MCAIEAARPGWISVLRILRIEPYLDTLLEFVQSTKIAGSVFKAAMAFSKLPK
jgi:hypothetical protein